MSRATCATYAGWGTVLMAESLRKPDPRSDANPGFGRYAANMKQITAICIALVLAAGTGLLPAQTSAQAEKALESARHKEVVDGDLKGAIEQYRKIASQFSKQPEIAARALYQLGQCQEKLGQAEARQSYERIVRDYGSASQYTAMARARLSAMGVTQGGEVRTRLLWDKTPDLFGTTTSDGRFLCYPDWETGDLGLRDLVTGQSRHITNYKPKGDVEWCSIAPDGKRIAFTWCRWDKAAFSCELRMIGADGKDERILLQERDVKWVYPFRWSPDMKWIATGVHGQNGDGKLVLVSPEGAPARTLLTLAQREPDRITFSPDGKWLAFHSWAAGSLTDRYPLCVLPADGSASAATEVGADTLFSSWIYDALQPFSVRTMGWTPDGKALLFTREFNGARSLYLLPVANGKAVGEPHAIASASGIGARFLGMTPQGTLIYGSEKRTTEAVTLPLDPNGTAGTARITMPLTTFGLMGLGGGIRYSPDGKRVLYTPSTKTVLIRSLGDGSEHTMMPQMARMGRIEWAADSNSLLISGDTSNGPEGVYQVDLRNGAASPVFAGQGVRVMAASPDGATLYYQKQGAPVVARDLKTGSERTLVETGNATVDLKVSRDGKKLAVVAFGSLRIVDLATGQVQELYQPADPNVSGNPAFHGGDWSADGQRFLVFARVDNYHRTELWTFPVNGGEPTKQRVAGYYRGVWVSPDGKQLDTLQWEQLSQVWSLENFLPSAK